MVSLGALDVNGGEPGGNALDLSGGAPACKEPSARALREPLPSHLGAHLRSMSDHARLLSRAEGKLRIPSHLLRPDFSDDDDDEDEEEGGLREHSSNDWQSVRATQTPQSRGVKDLNQVGRVSSASSSAVVAEVARRALLGP